MTSSFQFWQMLAIAAFLAVPAMATVAADASRPPNVILIVADDLGYGDLGFHGGKDIPTRIWMLWPIPVCDSPPGTSRAPTVVQLGPGC